MIHRNAGTPIPATTLCLEAAIFKVRAVLVMAAIGACAFCFEAAAERETFAPGNPQISSVDDF